MFSVIRDRKDTEELYLVRPKKWVFSKNIPETFSLVCAACAGNGFDLPWFRVRGGLGGTPGADGYLVCLVFT